MPSEKRLVLISSTSRLRKECLRLLKHLRDATEGSNWHFLQLDDQLLLARCHAFIYVCGTSLREEDRERLLVALLLLHPKRRIILVAKRSPDENRGASLPASLKGVSKRVVRWEDDIAAAVRETLRFLDERPSSEQDLRRLLKPRVEIPEGWEGEGSEDDEWEDEQSDDEESEEEGSEEEEWEDEEPATGSVYPVWFGTNRKPHQDGSRFLAERNDRITRGCVEVFVPKAHRFAETGTSFWRRLLRFNLRDDNLAIRHVYQLKRSNFYASIKARMAQARKEGETHALVFLHGYNVSFEDAAIRAAQIGFDLRVNGATAFFSWPSRGDSKSYPADEACIEASEAHITEFLIEFAANCGADKIHMIAHSMGNRGLLRALHRVATRAEDSLKLKFEQIFLAAPDVDRDVFIDLAKIFGRYARRTTLYASGHDLPVYLSKKFHKAPRAGYCPPHTVIAGIDTVEVPDFDVDMLGHSYFANAAPLLHDMFDLMRHDSPPKHRQRIEPASDGKQSFWRLRR